MLKICTRDLVKIYIIISIINNIIISYKMVFFDINITIDILNEVIIFFNFLFISKNGMDQYKTFVEKKIKLHVCRYLGLPLHITQCRRN